MSKSILIITCPKCGHVFNPSGSIERMIRVCADQGREVFPLRCRGRGCGVTIEFDPRAVVANEHTEFRIRTDAEDRSRSIFRCPTATCYGWVEFFEETFSCGECGSGWKTEKQLQNAITEIVDRYPHRKEVYALSEDGAWQPVPLSEQPNDYTKLVGTEQWP